ncbi:hypothetical protein SAMN04515665_13112 [Blastococcus sp. DSM 46786]|nr:hypothetical protein SAMN04515665_13112 [Blastococcus sp. DSM 46786]
MPATGPGMRDTGDRAGNAASPPPGAGAGLAVVRRRLVER